MDIETRFLEYVGFDTQSDPSSTTIPSTMKQRKLGEFLVKQMLALGIEDAHLDEFGIVYGTINANQDDAPSLGFIAHMDTAPDASGKDIKPQIVKNYDGKAILLNKDLNLYLDPKDFENLHDVVGHDLITTDGTTLLGADDKAGIAIIMQMAEYLCTNKEVPHGTIKLAFTPDEEIGKDTEHFNVDKMKTDYTYTVDGGPIDEINYENFNAYQIDVEIFGRSVHPGTAKHQMINSVLVAMEFEQMLPTFDKPEYTEAYEGFNFLHAIKGGCEYTTMEYAVRNHDASKAKEQVLRFEAIATYLNDKYGYEICKITSALRYRNMYEILKEDMRPVKRVEDAMKRLDIIAKADPIRGGTTGAGLTFMGLPCPNLGTGGYNYHGRFEYVSITLMKQAVQLLLEIIKG